MGNNAISIAVAERPPAVHAGDRQRSFTYLAGKLVTAAEASKSHRFQAVTADIAALTDFGGDRTVVDVENVCVHLVIDVVARSIGTDIEFLVRRALVAECVNWDALVAHHLAEAVSREELRERRWRARSRTRHPWRSRKE